MPSGVKQVTIIGCGLIGGSLGLAIKRLPEPPKIVGYSKTKDSLDKALKRRAIDVASTSAVDGCIGSDIVFICTPVGIIVDITKEIYSSLKNGTIITDVGSTKANIVGPIESFLPQALTFIGGHPVTGSEHEGIDYADANLFRNAYYVLTPTEKTDTKAFKTLHSLLTSIGANVIAVDADKHDKILATISHLPHIVAASLMNLAAKQAAGKENWLLLAAGGFRDTTRIAASSPGIWLDICLENKEALLQNLAEFKETLANFSKLIEENDRQGLKKELDKARIARSDVPAKVKKDISELTEILLPVVDKPGIISEVTLTVGQLGINIEDIEIFHSTSDEGTLRLAVGSLNDAQKAASELKNKGFEVEVRKVIG